MGIIKRLSRNSNRIISMDKFLRENESEFLQLPNNSFIAVGESDCPVGSKCEGYQLSGAYKLGGSDAKTITTAEGDPLLVIDFELGLKEVLPEHTYEVAFGFENGDITESGSFYRDLEGKIDFRSAYEKGGLMEVRTNKSVATVDFATWTGEASFDEEGKTFKASAMRSFRHNSKDRELKLGVEHAWGTAFKVKDKNRKLIAGGSSKVMRMMLTPENGFSESGAANLSVALAAGLIS